MQPARTVTFAESAAQPQPTLLLRKFAPGLEDNPVAFKCLQSKYRGRSWTDENGRICVEMKGTVQEIVEKTFCETFKPLVVVLGSTIDIAKNDGVSMPLVRSQAKAWLKFIYHLAGACQMEDEEKRAAKAMTVLDTATMVEEVNERAGFKGYIYSETDPCPFKGPGHYVGGC